ncbi:cell division protein ZapA [Tetragenococcus halophilus subsp. flandriensis]|uniref:cell division protein ZapA n=1 Tax=Tetragenococcus halophilus TaxID=51669 RepID=UPI0023E9045B|nr:cell division protein ZapA [Tetragenococcus halophilus]GMA09081.1 cell division protein ZapA [Tetragenococcus halophilus subsp. flandriensis]
MVKQKNRFKATIENQNYTIISKEDPKHLKMVTELVNDQLKEIKRMSAEIDSEHAAILLAINTVSDQLKKQKELLDLKEENETLQQKASEVTELKERIQRIEEIEQEAKKVLKDQGNSDAQIHDHLQAQQILNEKRKQSIQKKVTQS